MSDEQEALESEGSESTEKSLVKSEPTPSSSVPNGVELGQSDSLRHMILGLAADASYERASEELNQYVIDSREFPTFRNRTERYVAHCHELIRAIKAKRSFPGLSTLPASKQHELKESAAQHFRDLSQGLKIIEQIRRELHLEDLRSTSWVLKTASICVGIILVILFIKDLNPGMAKSATVVGSKFINEFVNVVFQRLGL